mmetsp:Transcript_3160/g.7772  ORF Transcript_3160/g.7772 Transcript_3160/m.7772 type:complete len:233 (-) Transcript_3160:608-1306(-)
MWAAQLRAAARGSQPAARTRAGNAAPRISRKTASAASTASLAPASRRRRTRGYCGGKQGLGPATPARRLPSAPLLRRAPINPSMGHPFAASSVGQGRAGMDGGTDPKQVREDQWKEMLTEEQFRVLRQKGTEYPGTGEYNKMYPDQGAFHCAGCQAPLYDSKTKFDSGCGWPAFYAGIEGAVEEKPDADGMRIEIVCSKCGGHLGHVFKGEGFPTPTNERHCVNSVSLKFKP